MVFKDVLYSSVRLSAAYRSPFVPEKHCSKAVISLADECRPAVVETFPWAHPSVLKEFRQSVSPSKAKVHAPCFTRVQGLSVFPVVSISAFMTASTEAGVELNPLGLGENLENNHWISSWT